MSLFRKTFNLEQEIDLLHEELRTIFDLKQVVQSEPWQKLSEIFISRIASHEAAILALSSDPVKNEDEIRKRFALKSALAGVISAVNLTLGEEHNIQEKLKRYRKAASESGLDVKTAG